MASNFMNLEPEQLESIDGKFIEVNIDVGFCRKCGAALVLTQAVKIQEGRVDLHTGGFQSERIRCDECRAINCSGEGVDWMLLEDLQ